jgi:transcriptional regulator with XRE-family HTH domain
MILMPEDTAFAAKLDLALRSLSIGRGRLAAEIGVDKSVVSRWLSGAARPSAYNLERISRLIGGQCPGFSMLDWDHEPDAFGRRLGIGAAAAPLAPDDRTCHPGALPFGSLELAALETKRRASAYTGRWKVTRLSSSGEMIAFSEHLLIRPDGAGLTIEHRFATHMLKGWLLISEGTLYAFVSDSADGSFAYYCLNGVVGPKAHRLDGIHTSVGGHRATTPFAQIIVLERVGDLEGAEADDAWADEGTANWGAVNIGDLDSSIVAAIGRDFGASAAREGGEAVLRVPLERSLASGGY